jgi:hypothetical protein
MVRNAHLNIFVVCNLCPVSGARGCIRTLIETGMRHLQQKRLVLLSWAGHQAMGLKVNREKRWVGKSPN